jgi:hypothetical protein
MNASKERGRLSNSARSFGHLISAKRLIKSQMRRARSRRSLRSHVRLPMFAEQRVSKQTEGALSARPTRPRSSPRILLAFSSPTSICLGRGRENRRRIVGIATSATSLLTRQPFLEDTRYRKARDRSRDHLQTSRPDQHNRPGGGRVRLCENPYGGLAKSFLGI